MVMIIAGSMTGPDFWDTVVIEFPTFTETAGISRVMAGYHINLDKAIRAY